MSDFEKLGAFYLGRRYDMESGEVGDETILYDAKDLCTHAVCVGMTGSGKTGLCVSLLEEAALDGIPAIAIDPKGDLGNLMLTFPDLDAASFLPWIDPAEAQRKGNTVEEHARATADLWRKGLAKWGQDGDRIRRLRESADFAIYTPGGSAGRQITVLRSFTAPPAELLDDGDAMRERTLSAVSGVLALVGVDADPIRSREHILLSAIVARAWSAGRDLDIATLIREIQSPPFERLGVLDLESFFPAKERFDLAMLMNNLLASPAFAAWSEGEPLDIGRLLYGDDGRPRISILNIAHLSESERMFFVTLLLNEVVAWMRTQPGTNSLRALLYMDEVFGFFPPSANPPSKTPMLTLMKQARAYGLGVVLATQNPVDLDYKGLSNAGTWFLGRLQTERDKARVIEGLEGASASAGASFDRGRMEQVLAGLGSRVFLMNNVHEDEPVIFHTRWAMSYLRGPLTRAQIAQLHAEQGGATTAEAPASPPAARGRKAAKKPARRRARKAEEAPAPEASRPVLPPKIDEVFVAADPLADSGSGDLLYRPAVLGVGTLHYANARAGVDQWETTAVVAPIASDAALRDPWKQGEPVPAQRLALLDEPDDEARFAPLPGAAAKPERYTRWSKMLKTHLYQTRPLRLLKCRDPKGISKPGQPEGEFRAQLRQLSHEKRDLEIEKLRKRYTPKLARLKDQIQRAEARVEREASQYSGQKTQAAISIGASVLGALFGRKLGSASNVGRATTAARSMSRARREREDIAAAEERVEEYRQRLQELAAEFDETLEGVREKFASAEVECEPLDIRPRKTDLAVDRVCLAWVPWRVGPDGVAEPVHGLDAEETA